MDRLESVTEAFVVESRRILSENLVRVYLHGSAAMGCFNREKSDIDLLTVVNESPSDEIKKRYMDMVVRLNEEAPEKGIEMSIVRKSVCRPFVYPTPFELHFSAAHLKWYKDNPADYLLKMKGTDRDLAAHFTIVFYRGKCLYGREIKDVFEKVSREHYLDSILFDVENAGEDIITNPVYIILNLCRVLACQREGLILSKKEGGEWGLKALPGKYHGLISQALGEYMSAEGQCLNEDHAREYASYMLDQISRPVVENCDRRL